MKKTILLIITTFFISAIFAQEIKIGVEGNRGMWKSYGNINATLSKGKWFIKPSLKYGNFGKNDSVAAVENVYLNIEMEPIEGHPNYFYTSFWSRSVNRGVSPELKLGYTFGKEEKRSSFVIALSFAYYWIKDDYKDVYSVMDIHTGEKDLLVVSAKEKVKHQNYSIGLSLYYGFKVNEKLSLLAGLNLPYYQPIVSAHYNPKGNRGSFGKVVMLNSLNPDYSIGINYKLK